MIDYTIDIPYFISHYEHENENENENENKNKSVQSSNDNNNSSHGLISRKKLSLFALTPRPKPGSPTPEFPSQFPIQ